MKFKVGEKWLIKNPKLNILFKFIKYYYQHEQRPHNTSLPSPSQGLCPCPGRRVEPQLFAPRVRLHRVPEKAAESRETGCRREGQVRPRLPATLRRPQGTLGEVSTGYLTRSPFFRASGRAQRKKQFLNYIILFFYFLLN